MSPPPRRPRRQRAPSRRPVPSLRRRWPSQPRQLPAAVPRRGRGRQDQGMQRKVVCGAFPRYTAGSEMTAAAAASRRSRTARAPHAARNEKRQDRARARDRAHAGRRHQQGQARGERAVRPTLANHQPAHGADQAARGGQAQWVARADAHGRHRRDDVGPRARGPEHRHCPAGVHLHGRGRGEALPRGRRGRAAPSPRSRPSRTRSTTHS